LVHAQASPTAASPVTTGRPSITNRRWRSSTPAIGSTSVIGVPSSQCACSGQAATTLVNSSGWRRALSGPSLLPPNTVIDQVSLSPGRVSTDTLPRATNARPRSRGETGPVK
jgi:hypothetical protein